MPEAAEALTRRLRSAEELAGVVRTMKALSAASIRQYERSVASVHAYGRTIELGLHVALREQGPPAPPLPQRALRSALVIFGSDYGLCGQFDDEIARHAFEREERGPAGEPAWVLCVGARLAARLRALGRAPDVELPAPGATGGLERAARSLLVEVDTFAGGAPARVLLVHHRRRSPGERRLHAEQLLPIDPARFRRIVDEPWPSRVLPTFTMGAPRLLSALLRQHLFVSVLRALSESAASEHASRLETMQAAERNLDERVRELRGALHRRRQAAITSELLDLVSGFEVLRDGGRERGAQSPPARRAAPT